eukprot:CAMPEP_0202380466 /NCGR_PEP_ID=MMETSP1127-20130417/28706_1 /ASSEMBLY_ACC=CAM_ASM_000462 /TAXON_ID=3047 /ORGANISM="Dunaliella tertiolecta, Strain CCMP1320" /LENGTH=40 /DNA_ID= /DNA_START= /DNA_END= /DNA_ORIENTATION=
MPWYPWLRPAMGPCGAGRAPEAADNSMAEGIGGGGAGSCV